MGFNLNDYEDVQTRVQRFQKAYPVGRIEVDVINHDAVRGLILVKASVFREHEDTVPAGSDIAFGDRDAYPSHLKKFYCEDTSTSAIGRALALVLETSTKPTKQDMERVESPNKFEQRAKKIVDEKVLVENAADPWTIQVKPMPVNLDEALTQLNDGVKPVEIHHCKHGEREIKQGVSKYNKPFYGQVCPSRDRADQCEAIWYVMDKTGRWVLPKPKAESKELAL